MPVPVAGQQSHRRAERSLSSPRRLLAPCFPALAFTALSLPALSLPALAVPALGSLALDLPAVGNLAQDATTRVQLPSPALVPGTGRPAGRVAAGDPG